MAGSGTDTGEVRPAGSKSGRWRPMREWAPLAGLAVGFLGVIATVLGVGVATLDAVERMRTEMLSLNQESRPTAGQ